MPKQRDKTYYKNVALNKCRNKVTKEYHKQCGTKQMMKQSDKTMIIKWCLK